MNIANICYLEPVLSTNLNSEFKKLVDSKKHHNFKKRFNYYDDNDLEKMKINDIKTYNRIMKNRRTANNSRLNKINIINNLKTENEHIKTKNKHFKIENERIKNENNDLKIENERYKNITFIVSFENKQIKKENNDLKTENKRYRNIINKYKKYKEAIE